MALMLHGLVRDIPMEHHFKPVLRLASVHPIPGLDLIAVCSTYTEQPATDPEGEMTAALRHHDLLAQLAAATDVLPVRFGTVFSGEAALMRALEQQSSTYRDAAKRLAGKVEFALRATRQQIKERRATHTPQGANSDDHRAIGEATPTTGRGYLTRQRHLRNDRTDASARLAAILEKVSVLAERHSSSIAPGHPRGDRIFDLALLVPRDSAPSLQADLDVLSSDASALGVNLELLGPWPAYSFCDPLESTPESAASGQAA